MGDSTTSYEYGWYSTDLVDPGNNSWQPLRSSVRGEQKVIDFYTYMALEGRAFQVRAGTITTPLIGDVVITDTAAEMATSAGAGTTIIPCELGISVRLGTGTLHEYAAKSVGATHTPGTAFIAMPLRIGGVTASSFSTVAAAGAVAVAAELATTTRRLWEYANPVAAGAGNDPGLAAVASVTWMPRLPSALDGPACFYVQIAATGTGPSYYAHYNFLELPTINVS